MAVAYMKGGGERKFLGPIINYAGEYAIRSKGVGAITQTDLAHLADALYPETNLNTARVLQIEDVKGISQTKEVGR